MSTFVTRFIWTVAVLAALLFIGTVGYVTIEGQPIPESLYMTAITITAVGYHEVFELSTVGRGFTLVILLLGISWMGLWFANITSLFVELDLKETMRRRRNMKDIDHMKDHVIICGAGRSGRQVAQEIDTITKDFVVIERDPHRIDELAEYVPDAHVIEGDATHDHVLLEAGLMRAKGLVACLSADTDNLFVCLSARDLAATVKIVARAYEEETISKLYRAGADDVVSPNVSSAIRMASIILKPSTASLFDVATRSGSKTTLQAEEATITKASKVAGKTLADIEIPKKTGLVVIAVKTGPGPADMNFNPSAETVLNPGDELVVLGDEDQVRDLRALVS